jgi:hypothetical protein
MIVEMKGMDKCKNTRDLEMFGLPKRNTLRHLCLYWSCEYESCELQIKDSYKR